MQRRITSAYETFYFHKYHGMIKSLVVSIMPANLFEDGMSIARQEMIWAMAHFDVSKGSLLITYVHHRIHGVLRNVKHRETKATPTVSLDVAIRHNKRLVWRDSDAVHRIDLDDFLSRCLSGDESRVLKEYFGHEVSLRAIGKAIGRSRTTVLTLRDTALDKCRKFAQKQGLFRGAR